MSRIAEAGARQSAAEEIAAEAEDLLQAALGRHGGEDGPSGNSAVVRLREAAKQIRTEIRGMDVSIALLSARLLAVRISTQRDAARSALQARKSRHNKKAESNDSSVLDD